MMDNRPVGQRMEERKRRLVESGVIGRVVDDFNPRLELTLGYDDTQINMGDEVIPAEVQRGPTSIEYHIDAIEQLEGFGDRELVAMVMTDPDAPGGEYLHWLISFFIVVDGVQEFLYKEAVAYEPPRPGAHKIVFTLFKVEYSIDSIFPWSNSRENFSTRAFADTNELGAPLGASFFNIKYENEEKQKSKANAESASKKRKVHKSTKKRKKFKKLADLY